MATVVEAVTTLLTVGGLVYMLLALWGARDFEHRWRRAARGGRGWGGLRAGCDDSEAAEGRGRAHVCGLCEPLRQQYAGKFEILFGVSSMDDPAVAEIARLRAEFPACAIRLIVCPERLGTSGKVSNLIQMLREAQLRLHPDQ